MGNPVCVCRFLGLLTLSLSPELCIINFLPLFITDSYTTPVLPSFLVKWCNRIPFNSTSLYVFLFRNSSNDSSVGQNKVSSSPSLCLPFFMNETTSDQSFFSLSMRMKLWHPAERTIGRRTSSVESSINLMKMNNGGFPFSEIQIPHEFTVNSLLKMRDSVLRSTQCDWRRMCGEIISPRKSRNESYFFTTKYFSSNLSQNQNMFLCF